MRRVNFVLLCLAASLPASASRQFRGPSDTLLGGKESIPVTGTISFQVNPQFAPRDNAYHIFFEQYDFTGKNYFQVLTGNDGSIYAEWKNGAAIVTARAVAGAYVLKQNAWNSVVVTWSQGGALTLYINGRQVASAGSCPSGSLADAVLSFGNRALGGADARSQVAQYGVWSRVLSSREITQLWERNPPSRLPEGLWAEYDLTGDGLAAQAGSSAALRDAGPAAAADPPPPPPPAITLTGPGTGFAGDSSNFTVTATNFSGPVVIAPGDRGAGGQFHPGRVRLTSGEPIRGVYL